MANKKREEEIMLNEASENIEVADVAEELVEVPKTNVGYYATDKAKEVHTSSEGLKNCLRNERVEVRHIDKQTGMVTDPRHVLYGGMAENSKKTYTVPLLRSGSLADVLTRDEKDYLEYVLGLDSNALSVYKKDDNFWSTANPNGISTVVLEKRSNYLNLADPVDYIKYKILLANKDRIAASVQELQDHPKATYEYVIVSEKDTNKLATTKLSIRKQAYKILGKYEDDYDVLKFIVETIDGRPIMANTKIDLLQVKADEIIQNNANLFVKIASDKLLDTKVLIKKALNAGIISKRGDFLYMREDNTPLCENGQDPTLNTAANFLSNPKHQTLKFSIEAKLKE